MHASLNCCCSLKVARCLILACVLTLCRPLQDTVGKQAVQKLTSLYGTRYRVGSICNIICESLR